MKRKKIIAIILCVCVILPIFSVGAISFAKANPDIISLPFSGSHQKPEFNAGNMRGTADLAPELAEGKEITVKLPDSNAEEVFKGTKKTIGVKGNGKAADNNTSATDLYNLGKKEIEALINGGYTLKQIFEADEIGNRIMENPANLLERSKNEHKELKDIEKAIMSERKQKQLDGLKEKYSMEYAELKNEQFNDQDISTLLVFYDQNDVKSMKELARQYKENGDKALSKALKAKSSSLSKEKMDMYGISEADAEGLNDEILTSLEELSKKTDKPVKDLVKGMKAAQSRMGGK